jgi:hypothetical protein
MRVQSPAFLASVAVLDTWETLGHAAGYGWVRRSDGMLAANTTAPIATLNGVFVIDEKVSAAAVAGELDALTDVPHCLQGRPICAATLQPLAEHRDLVRVVDTPLMVLSDLAALERTRATPELTLRPVAPGQADVYARTAAAGFEAPEDVFCQLLTESVLGAPGLQGYIGYVDDEPVTTGIGATRDGRTFIFNVATVLHARGRGFGGAVTARVARDALEGGSAVVCLQSSMIGQSVYSRLGFAQVEAWPCWVTRA